MLSKLLNIYKLSLATLALTCLLECMSWRKVKELNSNPHGKENYKKALYLNLKNKLVVSPPIYFVASIIFTEPNGLGNEALQVLGILLIQSIGYFLAHRWMHNPQNFWIHEFHHRFSRIVTPVVANAVSHHEYIYAYICPIFIGVAGIAPSKRAADTAIVIISIGNLLIHFESVEDMSIKYVPKYFVSTFLHLEHHRKYTRNFSAPILNIDNFFYG